MTEFDPDPEIAQRMEPTAPLPVRSTSHQFQKGVPRHPDAGRQAGKLNRHADLVDWAANLVRKFPMMELEDIGHADPIKVLMYWFWTGKTHTGILLKLADIIDIGRIIAPYIRPKLSSVEMVAEVDHRSSIEEQAKLAADPKYRAAAEALMESLIEQAAKAAEDKP